ncbi:MAG: ABC transporter permease subunit [Micromonosporaceae bacterium]|nr:ABC transporter permease subunit [Micromonosporaceae bacterium]
MRLFRAELTRLFARRFTKIMLLALVLALGLIAAVLITQTHQPDPAELQRAEERASSARAQCEQQQEDIPGRPGQYTPNCEDITASQFLDSYALNFRDEMPVLLFLFGGLLALFGYLVGASFLGAEWSSGGMANLLLWRTQRVRVLAGKLTALLLALVMLGLTIGAAWTAAVWLIAHFGGLPAELTPKFWRSLAFDGARALALVVIVTAGGAAIASLGRRTAAALGLLIGYLVVWEIGAQLVMEGLNVLAPRRFMLSSYVMSVITETHKVMDYQNCWDYDCAPYVFTITWPWALALLSVLALGAVLVALWSFRRRDVA